MPVQTPDVQTILERLDKLERQNRRLKRAALAVLILSAAVFMMGQARPTRTTEANKFVLRDADGRVRAELGMDFSSRPTLTFRDAKGFPVASLAGGDEPFLNLSRAGNEEQVTLFAGKDHYGLALYGKTIRAGLAVLKRSPALSLFDEAGKERAEIDLSKGEPSLGLFDASGKRRAILTMLEGIPALLLRDDKEKGFSLSVSANGPNLTLSDPQGFEMDLGSTSTVRVKTGATEQTSAAAIVMFGNDEKRNVIWQAP